MAHSEVARLLEQITSSYQAAQRALDSPAIMARHDFITQRMKEIATARDELQALVGDDAIKLVIERIDALKDTEPEQ